jgi:hypothetical protein
MTSLTQFVETAGVLLCRLPRSLYEIVLRSDIRFSLPLAWVLNNRNTFHNGKTIYMNLYSVKFTSPLGGKSVNSGYFIII